MKRAGIFVVIYLAVAVLTFGHVASSPHHCTDMTINKQVTCGSGLLASAGFFGGLFWPLYWSWEVQSHD